MAKFTNISVCNNITAGKGAFTVFVDTGGEEIKEVTFVYRPNSIATVWLCGEAQVKLKLANVYVTNQN